ncbi:hypothetical protein LINPERPRIM_LOCUS39036 [Linum perenne]
MAVAFTNLSQWLWSGKPREPRISNGSSLTVKQDADLLESDTLRFPLAKGRESDDSDYSIGWLEPHGPDFQSDEDNDDSFAVLVPCYGHVKDKEFQDSSQNGIGAIVNIPDGFSEGKSCVSDLLFCWLMGLC